jgi:hypothetical protein
MTPTWLTRPMVFRILIGLAVAALLAFHAFA